MQFVSLKHFLFKNKIKICTERLKTIVHIFLKASSSFTFTSGWLWGSSRERIHSWWLLVCQHRKMTSNFHVKSFGGFAFGRNQNYKIGQRTWPEQCKTAPSSSKFNSTGVELLFCNPDGADCQRPPGFHYWRRKLLSIICILFTESYYVLFSL